MSHTRIIAIGNQKGGVGKTTTTLNLGRALVQRGRKVMLIDADPQHSLTDCLRVQTGNGTGTLTHVMGHFEEGTHSIIQVARPVEAHLLLVPSDLGLQLASMGMLQRLGRESILKDALVSALRQLSGLDYILIDCPPNLGILTLNALVAAQEVLIPVQAEIMALRGLTQFQDTINQVRLKLNPDLKITGLLPTLVRIQTKHHQKVLAALNGPIAQRLGTTAFPEIPESIQAADAVLEGKAITDIKDSKVAIAYAQLASEVERV